MDDQNDRTGEAQNQSGAFLEYPFDRPWFLYDLSETLRQTLEDAGLGRESLELAATGLRLAFPPEVWRSMVETEEGRSILFGMHEPFLPSLVPLLKVGRDLAVCTPAPSSTALNDLRKSRSFWAASREIWVHARLSRRGLEIQTEPTVDGGKKPDFVVKGLGDRCFVEVKTNPMAEAEEAVSTLRLEVACAMDDCKRDLRTTLFRGTSALGELLARKDPRARTREATSEILDDCARAAQLVKAANHEPGVYCGGRFIEVCVESNPEALIGLVAIDLWEGLPIEKFVGRVIRKVREGNQQIPRNAHGIVIVDVGGVNRLDELAVWLRLEAKSNPKDFEKIRWVVAVVSRPSETVAEIDVAELLQVFEPKITPLERAIVEAILEHPIHQTPLKARSQREPVGRAFRPWTLFLVPLTAMPTDNGANE